jgi:hypothetical protein
MLSSLFETGLAIRTVALVLLLATFTFASACNGGNKGFSNGVPVDLGSTPTPLPQRSYEDGSNRAAVLISSFTDKKCKDFVEAFPSSFKDFDNLYGFDDEKGGGALYAKYPEHFPYFFSCGEVSDKQRLEKVISIGLDGRYRDGSPVDLFNGPAIDLITKNPVLAQSILDGLSDQKAISFWYFLFDFPTPKDKESQNQVESVKDRLGRNSKQAKLLDQAFNRLLREWDAG